MIPFRYASFGLIAIALSALAPEPASQTIEVKGLSFKVPNTWKSNQPTSRMRLAQVSVDPVPGDAEPAEMVVFAFPGGAGSVEENLKRWRAQFEDKDGNPPKITSEKRKGANVDVTYAEIAGRYVAAIRPGSPQRFDKPNYRMLGAIAETPDVAYFIRLVGPDKTVAAARPAFDALIASLKVAKE